MMQSVCCEKVTYLSYTFCEEHGVGNYPVKMPPPILALEKKLVEAKIILHALNMAVKWELCDEIKEAIGKFLEEGAKDE